jgi:hypothetical protein
MWRLFGLAVVSMAIWTTGAQAVEFKNVRAIYGPFGATRPTNEILPGDVVFLEFEITGLPVDPKHGMVEYGTKLVVIDPKGKEVLNKSDKKKLALGLGGNVVPERAIFIFGTDFAAGTYKLVVTITDIATKQFKEQTQIVKVLPPDFGFVHVSAPAVGLLGQDFPVEYALVGFGTDKKKNPKMVVTSRVLDENGKPTATEPLVSNIPEDLQPGQVVGEVVRLVSPVFLNRPGRFTLEIVARDELSKKSAKFTYTFKVIDTAK